MLRRFAPIKIVYNIALDTIAVSAAAAVLLVAHAGRPFQGFELLALATAGGIAGLVTYLAVAAVIAVAQDVPFLATWKRSAGLQLLTLAGNLGLAVGVLALAAAQPWLVVALPVVALCLHQGYEGRLRGHQERAAGQRHAAAVGRLTEDLDGPGVLRRAAEEACRLVEADVVDVVLPAREGQPAVLYRQRRRGKPWSGDPAKALAVPARLVAELPVPVGADVPPGQLRVWLASSASDLRLGRGEQTALASLALHTGTAVINARAHALETYWATHDSVTGLPNRRALLARIDALPSARGGTPDAGAEALAVIDLQHGYRSMGRLVGLRTAELLVTHAAERLREVAGEDEWVSQVNPDDFAVLFTGAAAALGPAHLRDRVQAMQAAIATPVDIAAGRVELVTTAGITYSPRPGEEGMELLRQANLALDRAREVYLPVDFYDTAGDLVGSPYALVLASELQAALDGGQLELHYQPVVSIPAGVPLAVEALVRWHHPTRGMLEPAEFIPVLERSPVHRNYLDWLLERALATRAFWGDRNLPVAVNVGDQCVLDPTFPTRVTEAVQHAGLPGDQLIIEIGESTALGGGGMVERTLTSLRTAGVQVAIDAVGTGRGQVWNIRRVPVTHLKIASVHVEDMLVDDDAATVVRLVMEMGRGADLEVVALGVTSDEQVAALTGLGCRAVQGGRFQTMQADQLLEFLRTAPTEDPALTAQVIPLAERRRSLQPPG